jgi:hypothetical protein
MIMPDNSPRPTDAGDSRAPVPVDLAAQLHALQAENAALRGQLGAMPPVALASRRWLVRVLQLIVLITGVAVAARYVRVSNDDIARGVRDGWREPVRR